MSRTTSASTRKRLCRASRRLSGSSSLELGRRSDDCRYVWLVTIERIRCFTSQRARDWRVELRMHELRRQPVEQLGMRRPLALRAEIVERLRQPGAEELAPRAVDEHARGQRIVARDQPVRQIEARRALAPGVERAEEARNRRLDDRAESSIQLPRGRMRVTRRLDRRPSSRHAGSTRRADRARSRAAAPRDSRPQPPDSTQIR